MQKKLHKFGYTNGAPYVAQNVKWITYETKTKFGNLRLQH